MLSIALLPTLFVSLCGVVVSSPLNLKARMGGQNCSPDLEESTFAIEASANTSLAWTFVANGPQLSEDAWILAPNPYDANDPAATPILFTANQTTYTFQLLNQTEWSQSNDAICLSAPYANNSAYLDYCEPGYAPVETLFDIACESCNSDKINFGNNCIISANNFNDQQCVNAKEGDSVTLGECSFDGMSDGFYTTWNFINQAGP